MDISVKTLVTMPKWVMLWWELSLQANFGWIYKYSMKAEKETTVLIIY